MHRSFAIIALCLFWLNYGCAPAPSSQSNLLSRPLERQVQMQKQQIDALETTVLRLQAQLEENQVLLRTLQQDLKRLEPANPSAEVATTAPEAQETVSAQPSATEIYRQAFADYTQERYPQAERGFSEFLRLYPENSFAATACYRLAQAQLAQGKKQQALSNFATVVSNYPDANKASDALYSMSILLKENNQLQHAEAALNRLIRDYPDSEAAKKAEAGLASFRE